MTSEPERRRHLDQMKEAPTIVVKLTPEQEASRAAWIEKLRQHNRDLYRKQQEREGRGWLNDPEKQEQKRQDAERRAAQRRLTITLPQDLLCPEGRELRNQMMCAAGVLIDQGRAGRQEEFVYAAAEACGFDIQTEADFDAISPWVKKGREMATEYRRRAAANDGQYLIW